MGNRVLLIGSGGREHALAWGLARSPSVSHIDCAPGNPGTAQFGQNFDVDATNPDRVVALAEQTGADLVVIGPEAPLIAGVTDALRQRDIPVFGPSASAARIEGSKAFAKDVMLTCGAPTGRFERHDNPSDAVAALDGFPGPFVVKADGLAAGKGVTVTPERKAAITAIEDALIRGRFGNAGASIVIEDFLDGPEISVFAVCDGHDAVVLPPAQDFKRAHDGDQGPNTGGMGAYTPVPAISAGDVDSLRDLIFRPVLKELDRRGTPFRGLLYAGLVLTAEGPQLLEFNARFGDPETQVVVPRITSDLGELLMASATGSVADLDVTLSNDAHVTVVCASGGYPGNYETGKPITGIDEAESIPEVTVFHAGTALDGDQLVTAGGRVLSVTAHGATIAEARAAAMEGVGRIHFDGMYTRTDIAAAAANA